MAFFRYGNDVRTKVLIPVGLLVVAFVVPVWASSRTETDPASPEMAPQPLNAPRQTPVAPPVPARGQLLYENHCMSCHESVVHIRTTKDTQSLQELRARVVHWAQYLNLCWGRDEVEDVVTHLNAQYYQFEPPSVR